jgi:hypothetical protein
MFTYLILACAYMQPALTPQVQQLPEVTVEATIADAYNAVAAGTVKEVTVVPATESDPCAKVIFVYEEEQPAEVAANQ